MVQCSSPSLILRNSLVEGNSHQGSNRCSQCDTDPKGCSSQINIIQVPARQKSKHFSQESHPGRGTFRTAGRGQMHHHPQQGFRMRRTILRIINMCQTWHLDSSFSTMQKRYHSLKQPLGGARGTVEPGTKISGEALLCTRICNLLPVPARLLLAGAWHGHLWGLLGGR